MTQEELLDLMSRLFNSDFETAAECQAAKDKVDKHFANVGLYLPHHSTKLSMDIFPGIHLEFSDGTVDKQPETKKPRTKTTVIPDGWVGAMSDSELVFVDDLPIEDEITDVRDTDKLLREIEGSLGCR